MTTTTNHLRRIFRAIVSNVLLIGPLACHAAADDAMHRLWSDQPVAFSGHNAENMRNQTRSWEQTIFPLGNGELGCTVFGDPKRERIQFNEDSLWIGDEEEIGGYQPFGDIYVDLGHEGVSNYRRELDLRRAVHTVSYASGGVNYQRVVFASHPAQVIVVRFTADQPGSLSGKVSLGNIHELPTSAAGRSLTLKGKSNQLQFWEVLKRKAAKKGDDISGKIIDLDFEAQLRVLNEGGEVRAMDGAVVFKDCDSLTLLLAADTNYVNQRGKGWRSEGLHDRINARLDAAQARAYEDLIAAHSEDFAVMYDRCAINLGKTPADTAALPTARRLDRYKAQFKEHGAADDHELEALLYHFARYLMISCSREGTLPANLQGLWLFNLFPAWRCDYHTDVNIQMNYWFVDQVNLSECFTPLAEWVHSIREVRREATKKEFGVRGWAFRSMNNPFGGDAYHWVPGDAAWVAQNLWDHYAFTLDQEYLRNRAYPVMKELCHYWEDSLIERELPVGKDGAMVKHLVSPKAQSPEHGPFAEGNSYDMQLCHDLFTNTIEASKALGVDEDYREKIAEMRSRLLKPQIGKWGQLQEWAEDLDDPKDTHRHLSHMIAVHPGRQISPETTPKLAEAAKVSMNARGDGQTGWSKAWKISIWARLHDGDRAYKLANEFIRNNVHPNLWGFHPPFQIDGNFGYAAGVNEMLVQSHMGFVHLLPSLPEAWPEGSVKGMRVRGGLGIDLAWADGKLVEARLSNISSPGENCRVQYGDQAWDLRVPRGQSITLGKEGLKQ